MQSGTPFVLCLCLPLLLHPTKWSRHQMLVIILFRTFLPIVNVMDDNVFSATESFLQISLYLTFKHSVFGQMNKSPVKDNITQVMHLKSLLLYIIKIYLS